MSEGEGPAALFLHAGIADHRMWQHQRGDFSGMRTVAFDRRGFGRSPWRSMPFSDLEDCVGLVDRLELTDLVVIGCSMGGGLALRLAVERREVVKGLVLVGADAPGFEPEPFEPPQWPDAVSAFEAGDLERVARLDAEMWVVGVGRSRGEVDDEVCRLVMEMDLIALATEAERMQHQTDRRLDSLVGLDLPTLVVVGEHDMPNLVESARHLASRLSEGPPLVIEDAAHLPSLERPKEFNRGLTDFFAAL